MVDLGLGTPMAAVSSRLLAPTLLIASLGLASGCSDRGIHSLAVEGNDAVRSGIDGASTDGWTITFDSFVVVVHNPGLIEQIDDKPVWVREAGVTVWDVTQDLGDEDALDRQIRATLYDGVDFRIAPASASGYEAAAGNVDADAVSDAVDGDWSVHVVGSATDGMATVAFDWSFDSNTFYRCRLEGEDGLELVADADETTVIEIQGEALFRAESGNADAALGFAAIAAADGDGDGTVTNDELDAAGLADTMAELSKELGGVRGVGACPEYEAPADDGE